MATTVTIKDGKFTAQLQAGTYTISNPTVAGYDTTTLPTQLTINTGTSTSGITIGANGTLTLHVTETGAAGGTAINGATFKRCDKDGAEFGALITSGVNGNAVFPNVPYGASTQNVYIKQLTTVGDHLFNAELQTFSLTLDSETEEIMNAVPTKTIALTSSDYANLPIEDGTFSIELNS